MVGFNFTLKDTQTLQLLHTTLVDQDPFAIQVDNLSPNREYTYAVGPEIGKFHTFSNTKSKLRIGVGSCTSTPSIANSWVSLKRQSPDLFIVTGDLFYYDITQNHTEAFGTAYHNIFESSHLRDFFHSTSLAYMWDDHDFGPNNSDGDSPAKVAARLAYQSYFPHYPFPNGASGNRPIYQSFTLNSGLVHIILTDLRSDSKKGKMIMGPEQYEWFLSELSQHKSYELILWISSRPWIGAADPTEDFWGGYAEQRRNISNYISAHNISNLLLVGGDAHMVAFDDGTHSDYSDLPAGSGAGMPVFQAASLDRRGSTKGGPFSLGCYAYLISWTEQYGLIDVFQDARNRTCVTVSGYRTSQGDASTESLLLQWTGCTPIVKKGSPGADFSCPAQLFPPGEWALLVLSYGAVILLLIFGAIYHIKTKNVVSERIYKRRWIGSVVYFVMVVLVSVVVALSISLGRLGPSRPTFLPAHVGWLVAGLDLLYLIGLIVDYYHQRNQGDY
uniref:PhoD-like phosphatase metallophosphatase domain-containing protein n=1 Tax=Arcella intermedia TaxID=1963864 RepID=A0A6B2L1V1_9EUKA